MDMIYQCALNFVSLKNYEYRFIVSQKRRNQELLLNFQDSDFFHLAGLHYLTDINIPKNRHKILDNIINKKKLTDELLDKSRFFTNPLPDRDIRSRIKELCSLEKYLDTKNFIRIYNTKNDSYLRSNIQADYMIESQIKGSSTTVYIFLKARKECPDYLCIVSFFKKNAITYGGDKLYWMLKEKICSNQSIILYKHPNYIPNI